MSGCTDVSASLIAKRDIHVGTNAVNHVAIVEVAMLTTEDGGRRGPTPPHQFGCIFQVEDDYFDCRIDLSTSGALTPGQTATVPIAFLHPDDVVPRLSVGTRCTLREARVIAHAVVRKVCTQKLNFPLRRA